jgi:hypothetical protein
MKVIQSLNAKLIDPIVNWIVDGITDRVEHLLEQALLSREAKNPVATPASAETGASDLVKHLRNHMKAMSYAKVIGELPAPQSPPPAAPRKSELCKQADFALDAYRYWIAAIKDIPILHRKQWEFFYICQALYEQGVLEKGRTGLGFGVGHEPLPALFASFGCNIVATDQRPESAIKAGWQETGQHADGIGALERPTICDPEAFRERVSFEAVDMNHIPPHFAQRFDFCWSACCLEHLGSIEHGLLFIENSMSTLKIGGVAIHTTEFNLSSDEDTLESPHLSIYRKCDIEAIARRLEKAGHHVKPLDLARGTTFLDGYVDLPPYSGAPHLRLRIQEYECTSVGLIVTRGR